MATDYLSELNGKLAELTPDTIKKLDSVLPAHWSKGNPVDVLGDASPERYKAAIDACLKDKNVDGILVLLSPQAMTDPTEVARLLLEVPNMAASTVDGGDGQSSYRRNRIISRTFRKFHDQYDHQVCCVFIC